MSAIIQSLIILAEIMAKKVWVVGRFRYGVGPMALDLTDYHI
jgi:hypothetical protein